MDPNGNTPWYLDKALYLTVLTVAFGFLNKKLGLNLSAEEVAALLLPVVAYVVGHKWKSGTIAAAQASQKVIEVKPDGTRIVRPATAAEIGRAGIGLALMLAALGLFALVALGGCAHQTPLERQVQGDVIDCGEHAVAAQVPSLVPQVTKTLMASGQADWSPELDALVLAGGAAAICAIHAVVVDLEAAHALEQEALAEVTPDAGPVVTASQAQAGAFRKALVQHLGAVRGEVYLLTHGHRLKPPSQPAAGAATAG